MIASELGLESEFKILNGIIGAFRGTAPTKATTETVPSVIARLSGNPYDEKRIKLFETVIDTFRKAQQADIHAALTLALYPLLRPKSVNAKETQVFPNQQVNGNVYQQVNGNVYQEVNASINQVTNTSISCKPCLPC